MVDARGTSGGKRYCSSGACGREKRRKGKGRGEHKTRGEGGKDKSSGGKRDRENSDPSKGAGAMSGRCVEAGHKTARCPGEVCGFCGGKGH